jgi:predicted membrane protein
VSTEISIFLFLGVVLICLGAVIFATGFVVLVYFCILEIIRRGRQNRRARAQGTEEAIEVFSSDPVEETFEKVFSRQGSKRGGRLRNL